MRAVGSSIPRFDAAEKVTGQAAYPADIDLPNQAWLKIVFAGVPHAPSFAWIRPGPRRWMVSSPF